MLDGYQQRVVLAHANPFTLGTLRFDPPHRLVSRGSESVVVEPRVMQLFVALARANGAVLSRDDLIEQCWDGRVVGDNAIQRAVSHARQIAARLADGSIEIETIKGVGYRLANGLPSSPESLPDHRTEPGDVAAAKLPPPNSVAGWLSGRSIAAGFVLAALASVAVAVFTDGSPAGPDPRPTLAVMVADSTTDRQRSARWAQHLSADLGRLARTGTGFPAPVDVSQHAGSSVPRNSYVVQIATDRRGIDGYVDVGLLAPGGESMLWSGRFTGSDGAAIRDQVAAKLANLLQCLLRAVDGGLRASVAPTYVRACEIAHDQPGMERVALLRRVMRDSPSFKAGWAELSVAEGMLVDLGSSNYGPTAETDRLTRSARQHLHRAKQLDPEGPTTFIAEALLSRFFDRKDWNSRLDLLDKAISLSPEMAPLYAVRSSIFFDLGRLRNATADARRAVELDPLSPSHRGQMINLLLYQGLVEAASAELAEAERLWPTSGAIRDSRNRYLLRYGDPRQAIAAFDRSGFSNPSRTVWEAYLQARRSGRAEDIDLAVDLSGELYEREPRWAIQHLQLLGHLGMVEQAYGLLASDPAVLREFLGDPTVLYREYMRPLRNDPRFMALAASAGVLSAWKRSGRWPDFCLAPDLPYDCQKVSAALDA